MTSETRWLDPDQQRNWRALLIGTQLLLDRLDADLQRVYGLSMAEYEIMVRLSERPGRQLRMAHLADSLAHSRSRVTHTVKRMELDGLVTRQEAADDGRGVFAVLTDKGYDLLQQASFVHVTGVRTHLVELVDEEDFAALGRAMNRVMDALVTRHPEMDIR